MEPSEYAGGKSGNEGFSINLNIPKKGMISHSRAEEDIQTLTERVFKHKKPSKKDRPDEL